ncbi:hypothetical protein TSAR_005087 [Trichomalopsis sarcophagae]|uniref:Uncharacterized protein n=1 Tax=Trichomalopsis sarcophagae TaxID=543379 RepID=A0A232FLD6_9HYME|nr:hypothetical protein TSAR_005087 [Trichomalopsis sarcophagae]
MSVYHNISRTTLSISIQFDMHIYFWKHFGKSSYFLFSQLFFFS